MKLGLFCMPLHQPGRLHAETYDEDLEMIARADKLGFSEVVDRGALHPPLGEHSGPRPVYRQGPGRNRADCDGYRRGPPAPP